MELFEGNLLTLVRNQKLAPTVKVDMCKSIAAGKEKYFELSAAHPFVTMELTSFTIHYWYHDTLIYSIKHSPHHMTFSTKKSEGWIESGYFFSI